MAKPSFLGEGGRALGAGLELRWSRDVVTIKSGGTLAFRNRTREAHNFSIVRRSQVPRSARQAENCRVCQPINDAHDFSAGPPRIDIVDKDGRGFNEPGDSAAFLDRRVSVKVTARPGRTLNYICAVHPWMQGKIEVKR